MSRGRPEVGPPIHVRLTADVLDRLDAYADEHDMTRAAAVRHILSIELPRITGADCTFAAAAGCPTR